VGKGAVAFGSELGPALLAVGYIVRLNIAALVFIGGAISWFIAIPIYTHFNPEVVSALQAAALIDGKDVMGAGDVAGSIWNAKIRYLGVGAMVVGGLWALVSMRTALIDGIKSGLAAVAKKEAMADLPREEQDIPMNWVLIAIVASIIPIFFLYRSVTGSVGIGLAMAFVMVVAGFLFSAVAGYMAGLVGSSSNPISGITIATILFASLLLYAVMGSDAGMTGAASAIFIGAVVCCAAAIAGDNMQDLKAGHILGTTPWKQQVMQIIGVAAAAVVIGPVLGLLHQAYGFVGASDPTIHLEPLTAPQAGLMASVAEGVFNQDLPWAFIYVGAGIGVAVIAADEWLRKTGASIRAPVLAVAVGIYLPLELATPILIGGLIAYFADKATKEHKGAAHKGLLVASGLITGEALVGIGLAVPIAISQDQSVLHLVTQPWGSWPGILLLACIAFGLYRVATDVREEA
jgi:putative OPT family oligopeptide transporter